MRLLARQDSGFALLAVLVLVVLLLAYSIVAQTSVLSTRTTAKSNRLGLIRMQQRAAILELVRAGQEVPGSPDYEVAVAPPTGGPSSPGISGWPGDVAVSINWLAAPYQTETYLLNREGRRAAAICLIRTPIVTTTATLMQPEAPVQ